MLTTSNNAPRPGSRYRSATNRSVLSQATNMVKSKLTWSSRNAHANNNFNNNNNASYKKHDSHIAIDTSYLSNNIPFTDAFPSNSKSSWLKIKKKANRAFLDKPWLLPTLAASSFVSALVIIFFALFSSSETHAEVENMTIPNNMNIPDSNINHYQNHHHQHHQHGGGAHRTMRKKYSSPSTPKTHDANNYKLSINKEPEIESYNSHSDHDNHYGYHGNDDSEYYGASSRFSLEKSVDYVFNLFHNNDANRWNAVSSLATKYCIDMPHFTLENPNAIPRTAMYLHQEEKEYKQNDNNNRLPNNNPDIRVAHMTGSAENPISPGKDESHL